MKIDETPDQDYEVVKIANVGIDQKTGRVKKGGYY